MDENSISRKRAIQCAAWMKEKHPDKKGDELLIEVYERGYIAGMVRAYKLAARGRRADRDGR